MGEIGEEHSESASPAGTSKVLDVHRLFGQNLSRCAGNSIAVAQADTIVVSPNQPDSIKKQYLGEASRDTSRSGRNGRPLRRWMPMPKETFRASHGPFLWHRCGRCAELSHV